MCGVVGLGRPLHAAEKTVCVSVTVREGHTPSPIGTLAAADAKAIISWGSCASWGCVQAAKPNPTQATPVHKVITDKPIIKVPGCPPIAEVIGLDHLYIEELWPSLVEASSKISDELLGPSPTGKRGFYSAQLDRVVWRSEAMSALNKYWSINELL